MRTIKRCPASHEQKHSLEISSWRGWHTPQDPENTEENLMMRNMSITIFILHLNTISCNQNHFTTHRDVSVSSGDIFFPVTTWYVVIKPYRLSLKPRLFFYRTFEGVCRLRRPLGGSSGGMRSDGLSFPWMGEGTGSGSHTHERDIQYIRTEILLQRVKTTSPTD